MKGEISPLKRLFVVCLLTTSPYIIGSLYFICMSDQKCLSDSLFSEIQNGAYDGSGPKNFSLVIWLKILTALQASYLGLMTFMVGVNWSEDEPSLYSMSITLMFTLFNCVFELIWVIVGSIGYWGNLSSNCDSPINSYLNFILITIYLSRFLNVFFAHRFRKKQSNSNAERQSLEEAALKDSQENQESFTKLNASSPSKLINESHLNQNNESNCQKQKKNNHLSKNNSSFNEKSTNIQTGSSKTEQKNVNVFEFFQKKLFESGNTSELSHTPVSNSVSGQNSPADKSLNCSAQQNIVEDLEQNPDQTKRKNKK